MYFVIIFTISSLIYLFLLCTFNDLLTSSLELHIGFYNRKMHSYQEEILQM